MYRAGMRVEKVEEPLWDRVERFPQAHHFEAGTFWSGLIDDVCIYNRLVQP